MAQKRCRTIGGIVFDLIATSKAPPCPRGRQRAELPEPKASEAKAEPTTVELKIGPALERVKPAPRGSRRSGERKKPLPPAVDRPPQVGDHVTVADRFGARLDHAIVTDAKPTINRGQAGIAVKFTTG